MKRSPSESAEEALTPPPSASAKKAKKDTPSPKKSGAGNGVWNSGKFEILTEEIIAVAAQHIDRDKMAEKVNGVHHVVPHKSSSPCS